MSSAPTIDVNTSNPQTNPGTGSQIKTPIVLGARPIVRRKPQRKSQSPVITHRDIDPTSIKMNSFRHSACLSPTPYRSGNSSRADSLNGISSPLNYTRPASASPLPSLSETKSGIPKSRRHHHHHNSTHKKKASKKGNGSGSS